MTEAHPDAAARPGRDDQIGYADALAELESILDELDGDEVDVDVLGARVRRASELLRLCRERIAGARFEVEQVVGELEAEADAAAAAAGRDDELEAEADAAAAAAGRDDELDDDEPDAGEPLDERDG